MTNSHSALRSIIIGLLLCGGTAQETVAGYMVPGEWGTVTLAGMTKADLVCAGTIISSRKLEGVEARWKPHRGGDDLEAHEADFRVDTVMRGSGELAGTRIKVQFVGSSADRPTFATELKTQRCFICAARRGPSTFRLLRGDAGSFAAAGAKPDLSDWAGLTFEQRMGRELASALAVSDRVSRVSTLRMASYLDLGDKELTDAIVAMSDGENADLAFQATLALVRMGHKDTFLQMDELLQKWNVKKRNPRSRMGEALRAARGRKRCRRRSGCSPTRTTRSGRVRRLPCGSLIHPMQ